MLESNLEYWVDRAYSAYMPMRSFSFVTLLLVASAILFLKPIPTHAQVHKSHRTQTELVVLHYEKLVANGSLLTPEGWERSATLFDRSNPYPPDSEIFLMSTGELLAENWVKGDRAEVGTKWNDDYGTIDSTLRYRPATPVAIIPLASLPFPIAESFRMNTSE